MKKKFAEIWLAFMLFFFSGCLVGLFVLFIVALWEFLGKFAFIFVGVFAMFLLTMWALEETSS